MGKVALTIGLVTLARFYMNYFQWLVVILNREGAAIDMGVELLRSKYNGDKFYFYVCI